MKLSYFLTWIETNGASFGLEIGIRSLLLLAPIAAIGLVFHRATAKSKQTLWVGGFLALAILPLGQLALPRLPLLPGNEISPRAAVSNERADVSSSLLMGTDSVPSNTPPATTETLPPAPDHTEPKGQETAAKIGPQGGGYSAPIETFLPSRLEESTITWRTPIFICWLLVAIFLFCRFLHATWQLNIWRKNAKEAPRKIQSVAANACRRAGLNETVPVLVTDHVRGPAIVGGFRPCFLVPTRCIEEDDYSITLEALLLHEAIHLKQRDTHLQFLVSFLRCIYWFNPFTYLGARAISREREIITDAAVVAQLETSADYAQGIVDVLRSKNKPSPLRFTLGAADGSRKDVEKRLNLIIAGGGQAWKQPRMITLLGNITLVASIAFLTMTIVQESSSASEMDTRQAKADVSTEAVRLVIDLPEPIPAGGETTMVDWPTWRRARVGSYIFEGRPHSLASLGDKLRHYGVANAAMRSSENGRTSTTILHLRVNRRRPVPDIMNVLSIASRKDIGIVKVDLAQDGSPEKLLKISLPLDGGMGNKLATDLFVYVEVPKTSSASDASKGAARISNYATKREIAKEIKSQLARRDSRSLVLSKGMKFEVFSRALREFSGDKRMLVSFQVHAMSPKAAKPIANQVASPKKAKSALNQGLAWLAAHQSKSGSISVGKAKDEGLVLGRTALATLALLSDGRTQDVGPHREVVKKSLAYLRSMQKKNTQSFHGCLAPKDSSYRNYAHALATLALAEAYTLSQDKALKEPLESAVAFILRAQNPYRGWRYGIRAGESDTSMTTWMLMALLAAKNSGIPMANRTFQMGQDVIRQMTDLDTGRTGYIIAGENPVRTPKTRLVYPSQLSESLTAMGLTVHGLLKTTSQQEPIISRSLTLLTRLTPKWTPEKGNVDYIYWYFGTTALRLHQNQGKEQWNNQLLLALIQGQTKSAEFAGSWPTRSPWGEEGGLVYTTAMACLSIESALSKH